MTKPNPYEYTVDEHCEAGTLLPRGPRILLKAILPTDNSSIAAPADWDARQAVFHEVVHVGPQVPQDAGLEPGMVVQHLNAAADRPGDVTSRWTLVHHEDVMSVLLPSK